MESIIFNYIGYSLIFCAALCVATPILVYLVSFAVGVVWDIVDEGDSESPDLLKKLMPFLFSDGVREWRGKWVVGEWFGLGRMTYSRSGHDTWGTSEYIEKYCTFNSKEEAKERSKNLSVCFLDPTRIVVLFCSLLITGAGLAIIPTITMYFLSSALCLISLRWSRRGYKKVKKLKESLEEHKKDKEAHQ